MIITVLDSVVSGRFVPDDELPVGRLKIAERALKTAALLGYRIDLGRPHFIDHTYILTQAAQDTGFLDFLRHCRFTHHYFGDKSVAAAAGSAMSKPKYYPSAWCFDNDAKRIAFAERVRAGQWAEANRQLGANSIESTMAQGLRRLDEWLRSPSHVVGAPTPDSPPEEAPIDMAWEQQANPTTPAYSLEQRILDKSNTLRGVLQGQAEWEPIGFDHTSAGESLKRLESVHRSLQTLEDGEHLNNRSAWLELLCEITSDKIEPPADLPEALAIQLVQHAYHEVLGASWGTDGLWVSDGYPANDLGERSIPLIKAIYPDAVDPDAGTRWAHQGLRCQYWKGDTPHDAPRLLDDLSWSQVAAYLQDEEIRQQQLISILARKAFTRALAEARNAHKHGGSYDQPEIAALALDVAKADQALREQLAKTLQIQVLAQNLQHNIETSTKHHQVFFAACGAVAGATAAGVVTGGLTGDPLTASSFTNGFVESLSTLAGGAMGALSGPSLTKTQVINHRIQQAARHKNEQLESSNFIEGKLIWEFQDGFPIF